MATDLFEQQMAAEREHNRALDAWRWGVRRGPYPIQPVPIEEAQKDYPLLLETVVAALPSLSERDIATVVSLIVGTCGDCHNAPSDCLCGMDD